MSNQRRNNMFTHVPVARVKRNTFDLSHEVKMSGKFGMLYPCMVMDVVPGDTIRSNTSTFMRFAPLLAPIMHRVDVRLESFFVPYRIICEPWQEFITGGQDGQADTVLPFFSPASYDSYVGWVSGLFYTGSLLDYMGLPIAPEVDPGAASTQPFSILPVRAYAKIWNDFYRDPNFDAELELNVADEGDVTTQSVDADLFSLRFRGYEKDYFTAALPFAQRGAQVLIPMEGQADFTYKGISHVYDQDGSNPDAGPLSTSGVNSLLGVGDGSGSGRIENIDEITFENGSVTINDLRRSFAVQRWLENNARGGARYTEQIQAHFDVTVPDYRLQRAEYLGGSSQPVQISEVLATAGTDGGGEEAPVGSPPVGDMAGHGISAGKGRGWSYRCQEHGVIITLVSVTYRTAYQQGVARMWTRQSKFDFAWPELANLGEQELKSKELYYSFNAAHDAANDTTFGYMPRYAEYKYLPDRVAGDFRSTLAFWHLGRIFTTRPVLDESFTTFTPDGGGDMEPETRIFAVQDGTDYLWFQIYHRVTAKRPLPYFGIPSGLG